MKEKRPNWDEYFMNIARSTRDRATCLKRHFGAVIVGDKRIIATGYNSAPPHLTTCSEDGCHEVNCHCVRTIHAEHNAILQLTCQSQNLSTFNEVFLYLAGEGQPCLECTKAIITVGIKRIVCEKIVNPKEHKKEYDFVAQMLKEAGVKLEELKK